jgi:hypothetical protein
MPDGEVDVKANRVNWDFDAFHDWSQSFERCAVAPLTDHDDDHAASLAGILTAYADDVAADARRLLAHAKSADNAPPEPTRTVRVFISTDNAGVRVRKQIAGGGLNTRLDLLDAAGRVMPWALFHSVALTREFGDWPKIETPQRADVMRDIARRAATAVAGKPPPRAVVLRVYAGTAWDGALSSISDAADVIRFETHRELDDFFTASVTRPPS